MPFLAFPKQLGKAWGKFIGNHPQVTVVYGRVKPMAFT
jgi:hypothetical protein